MSLRSVGGLAGVASVGMRSFGYISGMARGTRNATVRTLALLATVLVVAACSGDAHRIEGPTAPVPGEGDSSATDQSASSTASGSGSSPLGDAVVDGSEDPSEPRSGPLEVAWTKCPDHLSGLGLTCALATVPIDRVDPGAGSTQISVVIRPGVADEPVPALAVLQGGPGGASSDLAPMMPSERYATVLIDQRGVGFGSSDFWCDEYLAALPDMFEATADEAEAIHSEVVGRCSTQLQHDPVFAHTTTEAHAADVVDVMAALGFGRWFVYGVSYGSTIALEVLRDDPEGLAGAVLDGVYPGHLDFDADVAEAADRVIRELDSACGVDPACSAILGGAAGGEAPTIGDMLAELIPRFNATPVTVSLDAHETTMQQPLDVLIDGDSIAAVTFLMLYDTYLATLVPAVLAGLAGDADFDTAVRLVASLGVENAAESAQDGARATWAAVACAEWAPLASGPPASASDFAAAVVGDGTAAYCEPWGVAKSPVPSGPVGSDLPVLLISGWFDPITPPSFAEEAAQHLSASTHVVSRTPGHGLWLWDYEICVDLIVGQFLFEPGAELDTDCLSQDRPLHWRPLG